MNYETTERGMLYTESVGPLQVTYLTGKDAGAQDQVYDMSLGEMWLVNPTAQSIRVEYNALQTFFLGHLFEFGTGADPNSEDGPKNEFVWPRTRGMPEDMVSYDLAPNQRLPLSRKDLVETFERLGADYFLDGVICTRFRNVHLIIDGVAHPLEFGPACFKIDMDRDWDKVLADYRIFTAKREGRSTVDAD